MLSIKLVKFKIHRIKQTMKLDKYILEIRIFFLALRVVRYLAILERWFVKHWYA